MLARNHKLAVGTQGIVGHVAGTGQPRIALDVGADAVHFDNPDLPQTHSEMALPLRVGEQTFGALDVQSTQEAAFTEEDIATLGTLADQISVAIENARLFAQTQVALQAAEAAQAHYLRREWEQLLPVLSVARHEYRVSGVSPVGDAPLPEIEQALVTGAPVAVTPAPDDGIYTRALAVPIKLHDQVIGVIDLHETDSPREWTEDDMALVTEVADQAAQALENVRLFEQTQQQARREKMISTIAARVRAAPDVEGVLRTTVQEIRRALGATHGVIRLRTQEPVPASGQEAKTL
jgi:GAF domain-containing protein